MSEKIRFAVVGAGFIGRRHATMIQNNVEAELVGMADVNPALKSLVENQFKVPFFNSIEDLLASEIPFDIVNICTPNSLHAPHALLAIDKKKHVVIEKPMALSKKDCESIIQSSDQAGKKVFCVMQNRYSPPSRWLKQLVSSGKLGKINFVNVNCFWNRDERYYNASGWKGTKEFDGGTLFTQFSHFIDTVYWLFGDLNNFNAKFKNFNHVGMIEFEDTGMVTFDFMAGGSGSFNYTTSCWDTNFESSITIVGENGSVKVGGQYMNKVEYCHVKDYILPQLEESNPPNDYGHYKGSAANHHYVIENVIDTILGRSVATTNALEGLKIVEIIEKIYALK